MGGRRNEAFAPRHSVDADVKKASDHAPEYPENERPEMKWQRFPDVRVKHKCSFPARFASLAEAPGVRSRFPAPWLPGRATCRDHWRCGNRRFWLSEASA